MASLIPETFRSGSRFAFCLLFILALFSNEVSATHNRAGEITYRYIGPPPSWTYEVTIITYTKTSSSAADRPSLDSVYWGDGSPPVVFHRILKEDLGNDISRNTYINYHTYNGNGNFLIHFKIPIETQVLLIYPAQ